MVQIDRSVYFGNSRIYWRTLIGWWGGFVYQGHCYWTCAQSCGLPLSATRRGAPTQVLIPLGVRATAAFQRSQPIGPKSASQLCGWPCQLCGMESTKWHPCKSYSHTMRLNRLTLKWFPLCDLSCWLHTQWKNHHMMNLFLLTVTMSIPSLCKSYVMPLTSTLMSDQLFFPHSLECSNETNLKLRLNEILFNLFPGERGLGIVPYTEYVQVW